MHRPSSSAHNSHGHNPAALPPLLLPLISTPSIRSPNTTAASEKQLVSSYLPSDIEVFSGYICCTRALSQCKQKQVKGLKEPKPTKRRLTGTMSKLRSASVTKPNARDGLESLWGRGIITDGQGAAMEWNRYPNKENVSSMSFDRDYT